jgi:hypothetical protein
MKCIKLQGYGTACYACRVRHKTCHIGIPSAKTEWIHIKTRDPPAGDTVAQKHLKLDQDALKQMPREKAYISRVTRTVIQVVNTLPDDDAEMSDDIPAAASPATPSPPALSPPALSPPALSPPALSPPAPSPPAPSSRVRTEPFAFGKLVSSFMNISLEKNKLASLEELLASASMDQ